MKIIGFFINKPSLKSCSIALFVAFVQLSYTIFGLAKVSFFNNILPTVVYCIVLPFVLEASYVKNQERKTKVHKFVVVLLSFLLSAFLTLGYSIEVSHNFSLCYVNLLAASISLIKFGLLGYVFFHLISLIIIWLERPLQISDVRFNLKKVFLILVSTRLLLMILCFPGFFDFDAAFGLRTILNEGEVLCNHHPLFVQLIHGTFFNIGKMIGYPVIGMCILSIVSIVVSAFIMIYGLCLLRRIGLEKKWLMGITAIYTALPIFPVVTLYITKDGFFAYSFLLYFTTVFELFITKGKVCKEFRFILLHLLSIIFVCLTRHQGVYIVILETVVLLCYYGRLWWFVLRCTIPAFLLVWLFNNVLLPCLDVEPSNKKEMYGMLFQQTAYYLSQHPDDVTDSELKAVSVILDPTLIVDRYQYNIVDDVKSCYVYTEKGDDASDGMLHFRHVNHSGETDALKKYRHAWFSMFLKHPFTYIEATSAVIGGFFYNNGTCIYHIDTQWSESTLATNNEFTFYHFDTFANLYNKYIARVLRLPIISILFAMPYYIWLFLIITGLLLIRKDMMGISLIFPILLSIGVLFLCPVATGRYEWPIIMCLPLIVSYIKYSNNTNI